MSSATDSTMLLTSWLSIPSESDFSIYNLPFGVFSVPTEPGLRLRCATILGNTVIDLAVLEEAGLFLDIPGLDCNVFDQTTLNAFIAHPKPVWLQVRQRLMDLFSIAAITETSSYEDKDAVKMNSNLQAASFHTVDSVTLHMPVQVGDYTDFYASREHATNVGTMFRGKDNALQPNWLHMPVGYHGRASTVCVSGTNVRRPRGQLQKDKADPSQGSVYGPTQFLDFELEMAGVVGGPTNDIGTALTLDQAKDRIFGLLLMNDWSARDIQKWEYVPLGPFTAKNFCTTVSPWIVMVEALEAKSTSAVAQTDPVPLPYLQDPNYSSYDIALSVSIQPSSGGTTDSVSAAAAHSVCESNFRNLYWNTAQQLAHHTVSGCAMKAGDLIGSGTISGSSDTSFGSMLELSWQGTKEVSVGAGKTRKVLQDGDTIVMKGVCTKANGARVGFGECSGTILPAVAATVHSDTVPLDKERFCDFVLYGYWRSSSTWRVRVALAAKSIEYTTIPVNLVELQQKSKDYLERNPMGQVPLLEFTESATGKRIQLSQSLPIIKFLDNAFPKRKALIPKDTMDGATALEIVELINSGTQPLQNPIFLGELQLLSEGKIQAMNVAKTINEKGLKAVEALVCRRRGAPPEGGLFCMGSFSPTIVDAFLIPQIYNARRFGVDIDTVCPTLAKIDALCEQHPWFQVSHPKVQPDAPKGE